MSFLDKVYDGYLELISPLVGLKVCSDAYGAADPLMRYSCQLLVSLPIIILIVAIIVLYRCSCADDFKAYMRGLFNRSPPAIQPSSFRGGREGMGGGHYNTTAQHDIAYLKGCAPGELYYKVSPERCSYINRVPRNDAINYIREKQRLGGGRQAGEKFTERISPAEVKGRTPTEEEEHDVRHNQHSYSTSLYRRAGRTGNYTTNWSYINQPDAHLKVAKNPIDEPPIYYINGIPNDAATRAGLPAKKAAERFCPGDGGFLETYQGSQPYLRKKFENFHNPASVTDRFKTIKESAKFSQYDLADPWQAPRELFKKKGQSAAARCIGRRHGGRQDDTGGCRQLYRSLSGGSRSQKLTFSKHPVQYISDEPFKDPRFSQCIADCNNKFGKVVGQINSAP